MRTIKTIQFDEVTYRENFEAIVTRRDDKEEYILAAFLFRTEAVEFAKKQGKNVHVYVNCKAISSKVIYDRFFEIKL